MFKSKRELCVRFDGGGPVYSIINFPVFFMHELFLYCNACFNVTRSTRNDFTLIKTRDNYSNRFTANAVRINL